MSRSWRLSGGGTASGSFVFSTFPTGTWHNRFQAHGTRSMVMALIASDSNRIWYYFRLLAFGLGGHCPTLALLHLLLPVRTTPVWKADLQFSRRLWKLYNIRKISK